MADDWLANVEKPFPKLLHRSRRSHGAKDKCCVELKAQNDNLLSFLPNEDLTRVEMRYTASTATVMQCSGFAKSQK